MKPCTESELAEALLEIRDPTEVFGAATKTRLGGHVKASRFISTAGLNRVLKYEPRDLTISVEAGLPWCELSALLAENRQMVPLDPPYAHGATVGGVVATNSSGPRRRLYGTARDLVIGMRFATLEGKLVRSGGMVVKNVAGLDMGKLMVGSFGTLAVISSVNFKLIPLPLEQRTFELEFDNAGAAIAARDRLLAGALQPVAIDLIAVAGGFTLVIEAGGNAAMMTRYEQELGVRGRADYDWSAVQEFTPRYLNFHPEGCVARVSTTLAGLEAVLKSSDEPVLARAANAVAWLHFPNRETAERWAVRAERESWRFVFEYGMQRDSAVFGKDFEMMGKVKQLFDPKGLLNPGRLYGRI